MSASRDNRGNKTDVERSGEGEQENRKRNETDRETWRDKQERDCDRENKGER